MLHPVRNRGVKLRGKPRSWSWYKRSTAAARTSARSAEEKLKPKAIRQQVTTLKLLAEVPSQLPSPPLPSPPSFQTCGTLTFRRYFLPLPGSSLLGKLIDGSFLFSTHHAAAQKNASANPMLTHHQWTAVDKHSSRDIICIGHTGERRSGF
jgi:hypothetical protein